MFVVPSLREKQLRTELLHGEKNETLVLFLVLGHKAMSAGVVGV